MVARIFREQKKLYIALGAILTSLLLGIYLYAMFLPGLWLRDVFLYKQDDGSFIGSDLYASYQMRINPTEKGSDIFFSVNESVNQYQIVNHASFPKVQIFENDALVFKGNVHSIGDFYLLVDENDSLIKDIHITVGGTIPKTEELFPSYSWLYYCAITEEYETRGKPTMLILIFILAIVLVLDIIFPDLFFTLKYRFAVDGGEPSDLYRTGQIIGRVILVIAIIVCIVLSFTKH